MKLISRIAFIILSLMSIAAGLAKVLQIPQEVAFFAEAGLGALPLVALGVLQLVGGAIVWIGRLRKIGLLLITAGFFFSVLTIVITGNFMFAAVSMLPVMIGIGIVLHDRRTSIRP